MTITFACCYTVDIKLPQNVKVSSVAELEKLEKSNEEVAKAVFKAWQEAASYIRAKDLTIIELDNNSEE